MHVCMYVCMYECMCAFVISMTQKYYMPPPILTCVCWVIDCTINIQTNLHARHLPRAVRTATIQVWLLEMTQPCLLYYIIFEI